MIWHFLCIGGGGERTWEKGAKVLNGETKQSFQILTRVEIIITGVKMLKS